MKSIENILNDFIYAARRIMGADLKKLTVYGSYARGDYNEHSDIDIMILTSAGEDQIEAMGRALYDVTFDLFLKYDKQISVIVKNQSQFNYWLGALPFYDAVDSEGVALVG